MITGRFLITAGIAAAVLALTACSSGQKSAAGKETQKTEAQQEKAGTENRPAQQEENGTEARTAQQAESRTEAQASQYVKYRPEEAKEVMDSDEALIVVDVRTPEEYAESR
ncbi:MAG: rhodanese-like domain-containing protein, partial [Hungatella hathewayi]|nr:rhodanese-like domain-containing protein [Hungatella hathewayi]